MKYEIVKREGSHKLNDDEDAATVNAELLRIYDYSGSLHPEEVLEAAASPDSPLHRHFQWDDESAAHQHRLKQARNLIQSVEIRRIEDDRADEDGNIRAWVNVTRVEDNGISHRVYVPTVEAMSNEETRALVLKQALFDLNALQRKYGTLTELAAVFAAIDEVKEAVEVEVLV
jgi:hypothetical protein